MRRRTLLLTITPLVVLSTGIALVTSVALADPRPQPKRVAPVAAMRPGVVVDPIAARLEALEKKLAAAEAKNAAQDAKIRDLEASLITKSTIPPGFCGSQIVSGAALGFKPEYGDLHFQARRACK